jgi:hypothetical protein
MGNAAQIDDIKCAGSVMTENTEGKISLHLEDPVVDEGISNLS